MSTRSLLWGSYELKRTYQRNMAIGFGVSGGVHLLAILLVVLINSWTSGPIEAPEYTMIKSKSDIIVPPSLAQTQEQIKVATPDRVAKPQVGLPTPVPDEEAPEESQVITQNELADLAPVMPVENLEGNINVDVDKVMDELLPAADDFVPFEEAPVQVTTVQPKYPDLAQRASIEGTVWVKALVDKEGKVRDVIIAKASGANAGFEEAAIDAAKQTVWRPAISNGQPIAVWVTYKVEFKLK
jgi:periplasmic protein TonB